MSKHSQWLHEQLKSWVAEGVISSGQADALRLRHPEPKAGAPWGVIIFAGLGAVVGGLGVILLLAYNWQDIPKFGKLGLIFLSIAAAHVTGLQLFAKEDWRKSLGEAITLLGTMLYGAGIWLVAQIYHIEEHFPNGFLLWGLGALAMGWVMPSVAQGLLSVVLLAIWGCSEAWGFDQPIHFAPFLTLLAAGGLGWRLRSLVLLAVVLLGFNVVLLANVGALEGSLVLTVWLNLAAAFVAVGRLCRLRDRFAASEPIWGFFGWLGFLICLYLFTFVDMVDDLLDWNLAQQRTGYYVVLLYAWVTLAVSVAAWLALVFGRLRAQGKDTAQDWMAREDWLLPLTAILVQVICVSGLHQEKWLIAGPANLVFLALAVTWMARGCRQARVRSTVIGSVLFAALMVARYFDLFDSLWIRGLVFVVVGTVLFAEGILFMKARRRLRVEETSP